MNEYYVYRFIRKDNYTCFYIGKGKGKRAFGKGERNEYCRAVMKKHGYIVDIVKANLTEAEALNLEKDLIRKYVFEYNYNIAIKGYTERNDQGLTLTNLTWGGEGSSRPHTEEWKKQHSKDMTGDKNPMYGINLWDTYSELDAALIKEKLSDAFSGQNNPMYNVSPKERMDEATYSNWYKKKCENSKGSKNPNYGNHKLHEKLKDNPELRIAYYSRPAGQNGRAKKVYVFNSAGNLVHAFDCKIDCCKWLKEEFSLKNILKTINTKMSNAIENNTEYLGFYYSYTCQSVTKREKEAN